MADCECHGDVFCSDCSATLGRADATIADLRDRLRIMAPRVCEGCGCARAVFGHALCADCEEAEWGVPRGAPGGEWGDRAAACISVGLRRLCGRRILEGC